MSIDKNKAVVRRFITEVLGGGNIGVMEELLAPNYTNPSMGVTNRDGFKAVISSLKAIPIRKFEITNLVAEGDSVVFRGNMHFTPTSGKVVSARVITYYRLSNGLIVEDEPIVALDLQQEVEQFGCEVVGLAESADEAMMMAAVIISATKASPFFLDRFMTVSVLLSNYDSPQ